MFAVCTHRCTLCIKRLPFLHVDELKAGYVFAFLTTASLQQSVAASYRLVCLYGTACRQSLLHFSSRAQREGDGRELSPCTLSTMNYKCMDGGRSPRSAVTEKDSQCLCWRQKNAQHTTSAAGVTAFLLFLFLLRAP